MLCPELFSLIIIDHFPFCNYTYPNHIFCFLVIILSSLYKLARISVPIIRLSRDLLTPQLSSPRNPSRSLTFGGSGAGSRNDSFAAELTAFV